MMPLEDEAAENARKLQALREAAELGVRAIERGDYIEFPNLEALKAHLETLGTTR